MASPASGPPSRPWIETPCLYSAALSRAAGCNVYLKLECVQPSGSFKSRGIGNMMVRAAERASRASRADDTTTTAGGVRFYCSSGGNAGLACAVAARGLRAPATIVVPTSTSAYMVGKLRAAGADVRQTGADWAAADQHLREVLMGGGAEAGSGSRKDSGPDAVYVPPFDHADIWAGAATIVDELAVQLPPGVRPDALVCSVGGGGLLCGLMEGIERAWGAEGGREEGRATSQANPPRLLAVETAGAESLAASVAAGRLVTLPAITSIATSLGARRVAEQAFAWAQRSSPSPSVVPVVVSDADAVEAVVRLLDDERLLVEPACGAALAPLYARWQPSSPSSPLPTRPAAGLEERSTAGASLLRHHLGAGLTDAAWAARNVVVIVCGGSNINLDMLAAYRQQFGR